jgi:hypothetical protein
MPINSIVGGWSPGLKVSYRVLGFADAVNEKIIVEKELGYTRGNFF